ncbi:phosphohydrolase [Desulfoplanes formicivorans]|uniref:Phosphohydrolase n=1 Tax=Desulfoplanes formicivorans TaxID=1592317 RepID=A0A194AKF7_9BACT|nr:phosphohydrolase [Desulfoplanes formicivorans]
MVDDEPGLRDICREALVDCGYNVVCVGSGQEALEYLAKAQVDLILSDYRMPNMSGLELLEKVKTMGLDPDFLIMTGFGTIETAVECIKTGAADYLPKPFNISHLLLKEEKVLRDRQDRLDRKKLSSLVRMLNLSNALNVQLDLSALVQEFLFHVQKNFGPDSILFHLPDSQSFNRVTVRGALLRTNRPLFVWLNQLCEAVQRKGESKIVDRSTVALETNQPPASLEDFPYSIMVVPMVQYSRKIGIIAVVRSKNKPGYTPSDLQLLTVFSSHIASSLQNARLYTKMKTLNREVISSYAQAVEAKDIYTRGHSERVATYARNLGQFLGLSSKELDTLYMAGILHDIGKIGIPDSILNKPGKLTFEEYNVMKSHPQVGRDILSRVTSFKEILPIVYHHHERVDGRGYPEGLNGSEIPFLARVISVVDSYEAMTSDRAYRNALPPEEVRCILKAGAGTQWQEDLVQQWFQLIDSNPLAKGR